MKRFILLSFAFLAWVFYEMSGGADFEPASVRLARENPQVEPVLVEAAVTEPVAAEEPAPFVDTDPPLDDTVTRASLNLTTLQAVLEETEASEPQVETATVAPDDTGVPQNAGQTISSADTPAIIPSLIAPADSGTVIQTSGYANAGSGDIRTVTGNRVNVRGGPGTEYGVVTKLVRGDAVEVLQDNGDGWVLMRPLDGGSEGWMADFLLAGG